MSRVCRYLLFFQAEDGIRDLIVTGVQTCALPICFLRGVEFALLLVVVKDACRGVEVHGICLLRCFGLIQELSQAACLRKQIEITLDQLRRPERLETFFIDGKPLLERSLPVFDERPRLYGKNLVGGKFFMILRDELSRTGKILDGDQVLEKTRAQGRLLRVSRQPTAVLRHGNFRRESLRMDHAENTFERAPRALLGGRREFFGSVGWSGRGGRERLDLVERLQPAMIKVREGKLGRRFIR